MRIFFFSAEEDKKEEMLEKFHNFQKKAEVYYIYHSIQRYTVSVSKLYSQFFQIVFFKRFSDMQLYIRQTGFVQVLKVLESP